MKTKWIIAATSGLVVLTLAAGISAFSLSSNAIAKTNTSQVGVQGTENRVSFFSQVPPGQPKGGDNQELLADALGITMEELLAAQTAAQKAALAEAVEKGLITQAQADELANRSGRAGGFRGFKMGPESEIDLDALLAEQLGISVETLQAAQVKVRDAQFTQAVESGEMTEDQVELIKISEILRGYLDDAYQEAFKTAVSKAVADGAITQAQADLVLNSYANGAGFGMGEHGGMRGGPGHKGGPAGGPAGGPQDAPLPGELPETNPETGS